MKQQRGIVQESVAATSGPRSPIGKLLAAGMMVVQQPQVLEAIVEAAQSPQPEDALAAVAKSVIDGIDEKAGGTVPPDAMSKFALDLVELVASVASAAAGEQDDSLGPRTMKRLLEMSAQEVEQGGRQGPPQGGERPPQAMPEQQQPEMV